MSGENFVINLLLLIIFIGISIFAFLSIFTLVQTLVNLRKLDELQRIAVYESLAISFFVVMGIHLIQLLVSIVTPEPISLLAKFVISPGAYDGALMGNDPLHWDSFFIDSFILGIVYYIKRKRYGLI